MRVVLAYALYTARLVPPLPLFLPTSHLKNILTLKVYFFGIFWSCVCVCGGESNSNLFSSLRNKDINCKYG